MDAGLSGVIDSLDAFDEARLEAIRCANANSTSITSNQQSAAKPSSSPAQAGLQHQQTPAPPTHRQGMAPPYPGQAHAPNHQQQQQQLPGLNAFPMNPALFQAQQQALHSHAYQLARAQNQAQQQHIARLRQAQTPQHPNAGYPNAMTRSQIPHRQAACDQAHYPSLQLGQLAVQAGERHQLERNDPELKPGEIYIFPSHTRSMKMRTVRFGVRSQSLTVKIADVTVEDLKQRLRGRHLGGIRLELLAGAADQNHPWPWWEEYHDLEDGKRILSEYHDALGPGHGIMQDCGCELIVEYL